MNLRKLIHRFTKTEKIIFVFLGLTLIFLSYRIARAFYMEYTEITPIQGGVYIEGDVGQVDNLNPLFVPMGSIAQDISQLIFSGLTKFDTETGEIVGDLANVKVSNNGKTYTFVIKENAKWHDGTYVTSQDILYTYNDVIKNSEFRGDILTYNDYSGIKVSKIDDRTVEFLLERPDSFFLVKTMVGILPKHLLENETIAHLRTSPFNFNPIGSGPYKYISQVNFPDHTEYSLEAFEDFYDSHPNINNVHFKVFPTYDDLKKSLNTLDGVRTVPGEMTEDVLKRENFALSRYELPQYVAIFMNNESPMLKDTSVRIALQLGTNKEALAKLVGEHKTIDTPLLEIDQENWIHQYSISKANGSLYGTQWQIPNKEELLAEMESESESEKEVEEVDPTEEVTHISSPNGGKNFSTSIEPITITGTAPSNTKSIIINEYELKKYVPGDPGWSYIAAKKFDSLVDGENLYEVHAIDFNGEKKLLDSIKITFGTKEEKNEEEKENLKQENETAIDLPTRVNTEGETLTLNLITSSKPAVYGQIAELVKEQWRKIGVEINIEILENGKFQERVSTRDYDLLIFGQNLGYNLDAYPYWHSSQAKEGGLNLSQFKNFVVDSLLEKARLEDEEARQDTLEDIQKIISQEAPAIFLYSPTYYTALSKTINNRPFTHLATTSDRLGDIENWYAKVDRRLKEGTTPLTLLKWLGQQF
ncbi:MAG: ABC transporter substrate-binding protein [Candidatus Peregrinibacteria bacterium]|nr:ABC transporter substrate-binding protein [Candidatus Peregrinibacteria bacterium]